MTKVLHYEFVVLKKRWPIICAFLAVTVAFLILVSNIPSFTPTGFSLGYPNGMDAITVLRSYVARLATIEEGIKNGTLNKDDYVAEINLLNYFLSSGTTIYDYIPFDELYVSHPDGYYFAYGFSFMDGCCLFSILFGCLLGSYFFSYPIENNLMRPMIEQTAKRKNIYKGKICFGLILIFIFTLFSFLICLIIANPDLSRTVLITYHDYTYITSSVFLLILSKTIGLFVGAVFYFFLSVLFSLLFKKTSLTIGLPIVLFVSFFLFAHTYFPKWGEYGTLVGTAGYRNILMPFQNIIFSPTFGFIYEVVIMFGVYALICVGLYFISKALFRRIGL